MVLSTNNLGLHNKTFPLPNTPPTVINPFLSLVKPNIIIKKVQNDKNGDKNTYKRVQCSEVLVLLGMLHDLKEHKRWRVDWNWN